VLNALLRNRETPRGRGHATHRSRPPCAILTRHPRLPRLP
jgi:hypothetical protein